jgi:hypothetical protein
MITWDDPDDGVTTRNGVRELGTMMSWNLQQGLGQLARQHRGNPQTLGQAISQLATEMNRLPDEGYRELPVEQFGPLARVGLDEPIRRMSREPERDAVQDALRVSAAYDAGLPRSTSAAGTTCSSAARCATSSACASEDKPTSVW